MQLFWTQNRFFPEGKFTEKKTIFDRFAVRISFENTTISLRSRKSVFGIQKESQFKKRGIFKPMRNVKFSNSNSYLGFKRFFPEGKFTENLFSYFQKCSRESFVKLCQKMDPKNTVSGIQKKCSLFFTN